MNQRRMIGKRTACVGVMLVLLAVLSACASAKAPPSFDLQGKPPVYDYPINNPYAATIIGLPPEMKRDYSAVPKLSERRVTLFPNRSIPEGFWYEDGLKYTQLIQDAPAPLVYVIGGTGADAQAETSHTLAEMLYANGFSVVLLPSPTHPDFIINASRNFITGGVDQDAEDLYRVMAAIDETLVRDGVQIRGRMLTGYSLGALNAAFTARLDSRVRALRFQKVLLIDPPLSLYSSTQVIDHMLYRALPNGIDDADRFVKGLVSRLSRLKRSNDALDFQSERLLLDAYITYKPSDDRLASTIGLSFRLAGANMIFTSDVMSHSGYIFPKNRVFTTSTPLDGYMSVALRTSFRDYFNDMFTETLQREQPGLSKRQIIDESSLQALSAYIATHPDIGLVTNADDIILAPGESKQLADLFGARGVVFPNGGHLGNLAHPAVGYRIVRFLKQAPHAQ